MVGGHQWRGIPTGVRDREPSSWRLLTRLGQDGGLPEVSMKAFGIHVPQNTLQV